MAVSEQDMEKLVRFLKALADKNRIRILGLLSEREYTVKEMAATLQLAEPTVSQHLAMLKWSGLVQMRQEGNAKYHRLRPEEETSDNALHPDAGDSLHRLRQDSVHALLRDLTKRANAYTEANSDLSEFERKTLNTFFADGRLTQFPMQAKKQMVILKRLAQEFETEREYPEKEVNDILKRFHPDCATLRRQLVDHRFLTRQQGIYRRVPDSD